MTTNDLDFLNKRTKKYDFVIGIDPDCEESGFALLDMATKGIQVGKFSFPALFDKLLDIAGNERYLIVVEASWLNGHHNWHSKGADGQKVSSSKGYDIGRNHECGRKIVEMCKHWSIDVIEKAPLLKTWNGPDRKITQEEIEYFIPGFPKRSNNEMRDATLIAWDFAGFPIKVKPRTT